MGVIWASGNRSQCPLRKGLALLLPGSGAQVAVPLGLLHHVTHFVAWHIAANDGNIRAHGGHHAGAVGLPGPALVVPAQGFAHGGLTGGRLQACGAVPLLCHFQDQGCQLLACYQLLYGSQLPALVGRRIVLLAQQQHAGQRHGL